MTKAIKAKELFAANPGISNKEFVQLLMSELGMSIAGARTYSYNARNDLGTTGTKAPKAKKAPSERQLNKRLKLEKVMAEVKFGAKSKASKSKLEKSVRAINANFEKSADEIAKIKEANLERMKAVSSKLRPFRDRMDDVIRERSPGFDPELARLEIQDDERGVLESQGYVARPQMFD